MSAADKGWKSKADKGWKTKADKGWKTKEGVSKSWHILFFLFLQRFFFIGFSSGFFFIGLRRIYSEAFLLSDYSRIFADIWPLANGWRPKCAPYIFCHADFADDTDFFRGIFLSHRFHRFSQIFMESLVNRLVHLQGVSVSTEQVASAKIRE